MRKSFMFYICYYVIIETLLFQKQLACKNDNDIWNFYLIIKVLSISYANIATFGVSQSFSYWHYRYL